MLRGMRHCAAWCAGTTLQHALMSCFLYLGQACAHQRATVSVRDKRLLMLVKHILGGFNAEYFAVLCCSVGFTEGGN